MAEIRGARLITKRTSVPGKIPTGTTGNELNFIKSGELASNLADHSLWGFDGADVFEYGSNSFLGLTGGTVSGNLFVNGSFSANTLFSGSTDVETIIYSILSGGAPSDITRIQPGSNIITGGTANSLIISVVASPSFNSLSLSGAGQFAAVTAVTIATTSSGLSIRNSANTFSNTILSSEISGNTSFILPAVNLSDTFVMEQLSQTLTNKTINTTNNIITSTNLQQGDILKSNGTKYVRFGKGARHRFLKVNNAGTDLEWSSGPLTYSDNVSGNITTTSTTNVLIPGMQQLGIPSGRYLLSFGGVMQQTANGNQIYTSIFINGTQVTGSEMQFRRDNASDIKTQTIANFPISVPGGTQSASGNGGTSNSTTYGGVGNTNININFPALPIGAIVTSTNVFISYTANNPSYLSELRVRVTPPVASQETNLQPSTTNAAGTLSNVLLTSYNNESPVGNWLFEFRESLDDGSVNPDTNITDITIECNYIDVTQNGDVEIRWRVNSGTGTLINRYFSLIKV